VYPIAPPARTAVLLPVFRKSGPVRIFPQGWDEAAERFAPQSIAAAFTQLEELAGVAQPTHALIVIRREWEPRLSEQDRNFLWRNFRVPAFEQVIGEDGALLAFECEAHDGLHIVSPGFPAEDHEIERAPCGCGQTTPRLKTSKNGSVLRARACAKS
jgi:hypothetical protein